MSDRHVIVGAGPVGREVARVLIERGSEVVVVTRSGSAPDGTEGVAADASDPERLSEIATGARVLYNCANPKNYTLWQQVWPPLAASLLRAAEESGAVLAIAGNLYPYGPVDVPMTEDLPDVATDTKGALRAQMWSNALEAHRARRLSVFEVRGSDYVGSGVGDNGHITRVVPKAMSGKNVWMLGDLDQPHSWTDVRDMARALVAVADTPSAWGRIWHAPTNAPRSQREALSDALAVAGAAPVRARAVPPVLFAAMAKVVPMMRELAETSYQRDRAYVLDSSAITQTLGLEPTPWEEVCARTAAR